jgi:hypothetical protein
VFQKGRSQTDRWDGIAHAYGRFWQDAPDCTSPRRVVIPLGVCRTRSIAERKCAEHIERLGLNSTQHFFQSTSGITLRQQAEQWLKSLANDNRQYALDKWIYPSLGDTYLAHVNNFSLKQLVEQMAAKLSPASIRDYSNIVKAVVASAIDDNGEEKFPRKWNDEFLDLPTIEGQRQPSTNGEGMAAILRSAGGHYRMLYALLAGCGPLRAGEALGLEIDKHISDDYRTLSIEQKAKRGEIQPYLKTKNGAREVDLCSALAAMLKEFIGARTSGLLFRTSSGAQLLQTNTLRDSLHPVLKKLQHEIGGFNIFRRYRMTHLEKSDCPEALKHLWSGHAPRHVSERYVKLLTDRQYRLQWAERIGLGFELPGSSRNGQLGQLLQFPKAG